MKIQELRMRVYNSFAETMNAMMAEETDPEYIQDIKDNLASFKSDIKKAKTFNDFMSILDYHGYSIDEAGDYLFDIIIDR